MDFTLNQSRIKRVVLAAACVASLPTVTLAQPAAPGTATQPSPTAPPAPTPPPRLEALEGRPVRAIVFKISPAKPGLAPVPLDAENERLARNQLRLTEGLPFDSATVSDDISRLNRVGRFGRVESRVQPLADGSVQLDYIVSLQPLVTDVQAVGNRLLSDEELGQSIDSLVGTPVDPTQLDRACRRIEERYRQNGYYNTRVTVDEKELEQTGIVLFRVREGERTKVTDIRFSGNLSISETELKTVIKTKEALLLRKGPLDNELLAEDVASIARFYRDRGHLDARADRIVTPSADGREAIVNFIIDEGPVYTLRDIKVTFTDGEKGILTPHQLQGLMALKPGDVYRENMLTKSMDAIRDSYGKMGFADVAVRPRELREPEQPLVDVVIIVSQGQRFLTGEVVIRGNSLTRDDVIRRHITLQPNRPLDTTAVKESERRIKQTQLFLLGSVKATVQPETVEDPGYRDVLVEVQETNTGSFNLGGGVSSDGGVFATISVTQRNFDITNPPDTLGELFTGDAFRGGGQTLTLAAVPGNVSRELSIGLSDPYLFESDYSGSGRLFYFDRDYDSYDETRTGGSLRLGRQFGSRWNAYIPLRAESVALSDIDADAPVDYFEAEDESVLSSVGLHFTRSSLDNQTFPSEGNRIDFGADQFGLVGDYTFTKLDASYAVYFKLAEDVLGRTTAIQFNTRVGYIPGDTDAAPFFERFYLGGQNFRGFNYRAIAPVGLRADGSLSDDTVGGNFLFFAGLELRKPIFDEILSGVLFIDTGTVDEDVAFDKYRVAVGAGLRVYVPQVSPVPLAFDFGFPILKEDTDETRVFTFSVDLPFR